MRKVWTAIFLFLLTTVVAGCALGDDEASVAELPPIPNVEIVEDKNEPVVMDVYWDATCSMQGYTTIPQNNIYLGLPDNLEDIGTNLGEVHFFRFGENITPMEGRQHRKFMESGFYNEVITSANKVIENSDPNHLSIILTDLFETDADWSNLAKQIKEKYFLKYQSVAVIGIKNPFKGDIFDVGYENSGKIFYDSGLDTAKFRPFYMLVMGSDKDVRSFITKCKERMGNDERVKYLLFTNKMVDKVPDLTTMDTSNMKNIFIDSKLTINDKTYIITTDYSGFNIKHNNNSFYIVFKDADKLLTKDLNTIILYSEINLVSMLALLVLSYMIVFNIGIILSSMKKKIIDENNLSYIKKIATYFLICFSITLLSNITAGIITKVNIELDFKSLFEALITMFIYYIYKYVCTKKDLKD